MLTLNNVAIDYEQTRVLDGVSLSLQKGEIGCILGASGCGKTTLMRAIAGFKSVADGQIAIANNTVATASQQTPVANRNVGVIFQDFALFPHFDVMKNVAYGINHGSREDKEKLAQHFINLVGLQGFENKLPHELSGGQQQRVAIARALAPKPDLLLLDEPFSSLDPDLRATLAEEVRQIIKTNGTTALLITHDQNEAFAMSDKIGVLDDGKCAQWGSAFELYHQPKTRHIAGFIGEGSFIKGTAQQDSLGGWWVRSSLGMFALLNVEQINKFVNTTSYQSQDDGPDKQTFDVDLLVRPDDILHDDLSDVKARVFSRTFRGAQIMYQLTVGNEQEKVFCLAPSHHNHANGESFGIRLELQHVICFAV